MTYDIVGRSREHEIQVAEIAIMRKMIDKMENHEYRITNLEDTMRVNGVQEKHLEHAVNKKVIKLLGGKDSNAYRNNSLRGRVYAALNKEIKRKFAIPRRSELAAKDYEKAMNLIENWLIDRELEIEIGNCNNQLQLVN